MLSDRHPLAWLVHLARLRGLDRWWLLAVVAAWSFVAAGAAVALPRIDPNLDPGRPLELLSTVLLILPVSVHLTGLVAPSWRWEATRAVAPAAFELGAFVVQLVLGTAAAALVAGVVRPGTLSTPRVLASWWLVFAVGAVAARWRPEAPVAAGSLAALVVIASMTASLVVPWSANVLYNPALGTQALWTAGAAVLVAVIAHRRATGRVG